MTIELQAAWPIATAIIGAAFMAGSIVNKIKNGKHVTKEVFEEHRRLEDERWTSIQHSLAQLTTWIATHTGNSK